MSIIRALYSRNLNTILELKEKEWLSENRGTLYIIDGFWSKVVFVIENGLRAGGTSKKVKNIIDNECKAIEEIALKHSSLKLDSTHQFYCSLKTRIKKIQHALTSKSLCSPETLKNIKELASCPELVEARAAIKKGIYPKLMSEGINGSYIICNRKNEPIGIFKAKEQEAGATQNPKHYGAGVGLQVEKKFGIKPGTSYLRERLAYLLDKKDHLCGVPITKVVEFSSAYFPKISGQRNPPSTYQGSFQKWIPDSHHAYDDYKAISSVFWKSKGDLIPAEEIHKIAILDVRFLNCDRHMKNFLVDKNSVISPIDHGYILGNAKSLRYDWINFPQAKEPFSEKFKQYVKEIDVDKDITLIKKHIPTIAPNTLDLVRISTALLKVAVERGLTAYQIASLMLGRPIGGIRAMINQFIPIFKLLQSDNPSFFIEKICPPIFQNPNMDREKYLNKVIDNYQER